MSDDRQSSERKLHVKGRYLGRNESSAALMDDLNALENLDKLSEKEIAKASRVKSIGMVLIVIGIVAGIIVWLINDNGGDLPSPILVGLLFLLPAGAMIFYGLKKEKAAEQDEFPDHRYISCLGLIRLLEADTSSDSLFDLTLNLHAMPETDESLPNRRWSEGGKRLREKGTRESIFVLSGRFQDGTKFSYELSEIVGCHGEWFNYRAISGKTKSKLRARKRIRWMGTLRLRYKEKRYSLAADSESDIESMVQLPEGAKVKKVSMKESEVTLSAVTQSIKKKVKLKQNTDIPAAWQSMTVDDNVGPLLSHFSAMMFLSLYRVMNASKSTKQNS